MAEPGSISPALLTPSVTSTTTFDFAALAASRLAALASAMPMAVPSEISERSIAATSSSSIRRSVVRGERVSAVPPKTVNPMRSAGRRAMKSRTTRLATARRLSGWKSSAPMLPEMSSAIWMSIPSVVDSSQA